MSQKTAAQQIGQFATDFSYEELSPGLVESVKQRLIDILGISIAAAPLESSRAVRRYAEEQGGREDATAIGVPTRLPASLAALVNGTLAHSLDYDDTHLPSVLHPSAAVVPAALAAAQRHGATGKDLIRAVALGLEVTVRLGMVGFDEEAGNSVFFEHGQHATSICGALGSAVASASFQRDPDAIVDALGITASMAAGIIEANRTGGNIKRIHCGWAAHSAVIATELAQLGITGPPTSLEGRFGFFRAWLHRDVAVDEITSGLGHRWSIEDIFFKPYPANHFTHAGIDAARRIREAGVSVADIESIVLGAPAANLRTIGEPIDVKRRPATGYMAQFSGPYAVAVGLLGGAGLGAGLDDFTDELAQDPIRQQIMDKVSVVADEKCSAIFPSQFPATLRVTLTDGTELYEEVLFNRGGNKDPLTSDELRTKFRDNALRLISHPEADRLARTCEQLDQLDKVDELLDDLTTIDTDNRK